MKARDELRLSVLRMAKTALKLKQVELGRTLEESGRLAQSASSVIDHSRPAGRYPS